MSLFQNQRNLTKKGKLKEKMIKEKLNIKNLINTFCNVDLEKCKKLVYNVNVINLPNEKLDGVP